VEWTKGCYVGVFGCLAAVWGAWSLARPKAIGIAALLFAVLLLILGDSNPLSAAIWAHVTPLRFVRYPGNLAYLALPCLALLVSAGFERSRGRSLTVALLGLELLLYAWNSFPAAPRSLFTEAGPLARLLQSSLEESRYLLSPLALEKQGGFGIRDWKFRLYGLSNAPFRLRAAANFGEPLVPGILTSSWMNSIGGPTPRARAALFPGPTSDCFSPRARWRPPSA